MDKRKDANARNEREEQERTVKENRMTKEERGELRKDRRVKEEDENNNDT